MQSMQRALSATLCLAIFLGTGPDMSANSPNVHSDTRRAVDCEQKQGDACILHALNRLTFGPRPGDVGAVRAMGLERWFDQQLHPGKIDDSALQARLSAFPAMQLPPEDLLYRFPSKAIVRQVIDGKLPIPAQGVLHSVYENQVARVTAMRNERDRNPADVTQTGHALAPTMATIPQAAAESQAEPKESMDQDLVLD
jgi:hypothetical protein